MKIIGFCKDGVQVKGGRWLFWWNMFPSWPLFDNAKIKWSKE